MALFTASGAVQVVQAVAAVRGGDVTGFPGLLKGGNISTIGAQVWIALPTLQPLRNRIRQRNLLADRRLLPLVVLVALNLQGVEVVGYADGVE